MPKQSVALSLLAASLLLSACATPPPARPAVVRPAVTVQAVKPPAPVQPTATRPPEVAQDAVQREAQLERELAVREHRTQETRLWRVGYPVLRAAVPFCPQARQHSLGVSPINAWYYKAPLREDVRRVLGLGDPLMVYEPPSDTPTVRFGLRHGDLIETLNGQPAPGGEKAVSIFPATFAAAAQGRGMVRVGAHREFEVAPETVCAYELRLSESDVVNAYAKGRVVFIPRGMMRFAVNDTDLAAVIAHEVAHLGLNHLQAKATNAALGDQNAYSREFEIEADYVSLYILALGGMPLADVPTFWRRFAANRPASIDTAAGNTHPTSAERFIAMDATLKEIAAKKAAGQPLRPSRRIEATPAPAQVMAPGGIPPGK